MNKNMKVSLIIPVYNTEKYLAECLESAIKQDLDELEIICVNDGSTDNSALILEEYEKKDSRIKVITQENRGLSEARNTGVDSANGEYVCFLDSDDLLVENAISKLYQIAQEKDLEILCYDADCFYETEELKRLEYKDEYYHRKKSYNQTSIGRVLFCELIENDDFCDAAWLLFINRKWLIESGIRFYPSLIHEDCLFSFECFMTCNSIAHIKDALYLYRIRNNSIMTSKASFGSLKGRIVCYKTVLNFLLNNELEPRQQSAVSKFALFILYGLKYSDVALDEVERRKVEELNIVDKTIADSLFVGSANIYEFSPTMYFKGFNAMIYEAESIVLYGAGKIGRMLLAYLKKIGMVHKVKCFAVSEVQKNDEMIEGIPIMGIDTVEKTKDQLVFISARRDYQNTMLEKAKNQKFERIELIDFRLERLIQEYVLRG